MHLSRQSTCWWLRCSWNITGWLCSNYIFILDLIPGLNRVGKDNYKMRQETFIFRDLVWLILEIWQYISWCLKERFPVTWLGRLDLQWLWIKRKMRNFMKCGSSKLEALVWINDHVWHVTLLGTLHCFNSYALTVVRQSAQLLTIVCVSIYIYIVLISIALNFKFLFITFTKWLHI